MVVVMSNEDLQILRLRIIRAISIAFFIGITVGISLAYTFFVVLK